MAYQLDEYLGGRIQLGQEAPQQPVPRHCEKVSRNYVKHRHEAGYHSGKCPDRNYVLGPVPSPLLIRTRIRGVY